MAKAKRAVSSASQSTVALTSLIEQACLVAKDSAFNAGEFIAGASKMAFLAVKDCEKELDRIERTVDESITSAITEVTEAEARELLACLKFIIDLERIGDLAWSATKRLQGLTAPLLTEDSRDLTVMAETLEQMLGRIHHGFVNRKVESAGWVLQSDARLDTTCRAIFHRHLERTDPRRREYSTNLLFIAQAFERAGDHAKNLAEEVYHLVEGRSVRHELKRRQPDR
jgi:phosphate transport system protein